MLTKLLFFFAVVITVIATPLFSADTEPAFEIQDLSGSTSHYNGTMGTTAVNVPSSANKVISEFLLKCPIQTPLTTKCYISLDGGTTFFSLGVGEFLGWSLKGRIKQVQIKGSQAGVTYEMLVNFESY